MLCLVVSRAGQRSRLKGVTRKYPAPHTPCCAGRCAVRCFIAPRAVQSTQITIVYCDTMEHTYTEFGTALLRTSDSAEQLPDTWRSELLHKHLDSADRGSVALTCKAAHSWLLEDWPDATLTVPVKAPISERPGDPLRRLQGAKRSLRKRATRSTTLSLQQEEVMPEGDAWWGAYLSALSLTEAAPHIRLSLQLHTIPSALLSLAGQAFPGLQSLTLSQPSSAQQGSAIEPPPTTALPTLRHLTLSIPASHVSRLLASLFPFTQQLISLSIAAQTSAPMVRTVYDTALFTRLFQPASARSNTLRRLTLSCELTPALLAALQRAAPALDELAVSFLWHAPDTGDGAGGAAPAANGAAPAPTWGWRKLTLFGAEDIPASAWEWLPMSDQGKLVIELSHAISPWTVDVCLPLMDTVSARYTQPHGMHAST